MRQKIGIAGIFVLGLALSGGASAQEKADKGTENKEIVLREAIVIPSVGRYGRTGIYEDALLAQRIAGKREMPQVGEKIVLPDGKTRLWKSLSADKDGVFQDAALNGGYVAMSVSVASPQFMILEATGHTMVYVNGEPRIGDPYSTSYVRLPVTLKAGKNELLFSVGRGRLQARLTPPKASLMLSTGDLTLPDFVVGERDTQWGGVIVLNATGQQQNELVLRVKREGGRTTQTSLSGLSPTSLRKVGFRIEGVASDKPGEESLLLELAQKQNGAWKTLDTASIKVRVRKPEETRKRTFLSEIDGSVQYYAVNPARLLPKKDLAKASTKNTPLPALFLSLHGASVEALGQADAYAAKSWGHIVAPTNRRPYGFDWEDWGRQDALEVLHLAQKTLKTDPRRVYLTGHSMGGHGTWQIGATFPDQFAAIAPSAGWISFLSYGGAPRPENPDAIQTMLTRSTASSDTLAMLHNYAMQGVYILHGGADDNVPASEARTMREQLSAFHHDFEYFEQPGAGHWWDISDEPGADCVDWRPIFDLFSRHTLPTPESVRYVDFTTANPAVSSRCFWATVEAQEKDLLPSRIQIQLDFYKRRFVGKTENISRLSLDVSPLEKGGMLSVELEGQKLENISYPSSGSRLTLWRKKGTWTVGLPAPAAWKSPQRSGPFKMAFGHRMLFVYGTKGTSEENARSFPKARFDAETFWYRGNGSIEVIADTAFSPKATQDRNVILYGNSDNNAAWNLLLVDCPIQVKRGSVQVGTQTYTGEDLACLFLRPRPGSETALVGVVSATGEAGWTVAERLPYFVSGAGYPDVTVISAEMLSQGVKGIRATGFFGPDWSLKGADFVLK
ncbi:MAG: prolyl oligopeptidase family serine peptidase [Chthonomonadaceae bacterium]|nr:prolyl oligopeptidase family serine peptidase [Chthonomonadaceae bacterium]